jgi:SAM-dependent methyltransferase
MQGYPLSYGAVGVHIECSNAINTVPYPEVQLLCPRCKAEVDGLQCSYCQFQMEIHNGVVCALPPERVTYYAKFIAEYERIRAAEGRGSEGAEFYLALPYKDMSGRNSHQWEIRSRSYDFLIRHLLKPSHGRGSILDLGAGNCWMSFRLALLGYGMVAVDLLTNENDGLGAAGHFHKHLSTPIPRFQAEATHLPFRDEQFDVIIFNASFHYAEDYEAALSEALRCLKPGGRVIISDTPWYSREESGRRMVAERHAAFRQRFGSASDSLKSQEFLTDERLQGLEDNCSIRWTIHRPWYGWRWALRPWIARIRGRREPSSFRMYVARKHA